MLLQSQHNASLWIVARVKFDCIVLFVCYRQAPTSDACKRSPSCCAEGRICHLMGWAVMAIERPVDVRGSCPPPLGQHAHRAMRPCDMRGWCQCPAALDGPLLAKTTMAPPLCHHLGACRPAHKQVQWSGTKSMVLTTNTVRSDVPWELLIQFRMVSLP